MELNSAAPISSVVANERMEELKAKATSEGWTSTMPYWCANISTSFSPDHQWGVMYKFHKEDRDDRYSSDIKKGDYLLFHLNSESYQNSIGHFQYYWNQNTYADETTEIDGTEFEWIEDKPCTLLLKNYSVTIDLLTTSYDEIRRLCEQKRGTQTL